MPKLKCRICVIVVKEVGSELPVDKTHLALTVDFAVEVCKHAGDKAVLAEDVSSGVRDTTVECSSEIVLACEIPR